MKHKAGFVFLELLIAVSICSMLLFLTVAGVVRLCRGSLAISTWIWTAAGGLLFPTVARGIINVIGEARRRREMRAEENTRNGSRKRPANH